MRMHIVTDTQREQSEHVSFRNVVTPVQQSGTHSHTNTNTPTEIISRKWWHFFRKTLMMVKLVKLVKVMAAQYGASCRNPKSKKMLSAVTMTCSGTYIPTCSFTYTHMCRYTYIEITRRCRSYINTHHTYMWCMKRANSRGEDLC